MPDIFDLQVSPGKGEVYERFYLIFTKLNHHNGSSSRRNLHLWNTLVRAKNLQKICGQEYWHSYRTGELLQGRVSFAKSRSKILIESCWRRLNAAIELNGTMTNFKFSNVHTWALNSYIVDMIACFYNINYTCLEMAFVVNWSGKNKLNWIPYNATLICRSFPHTKTCIC